MKKKNDWLGKLMVWFHPKLGQLYQKLRQLYQDKPWFQRLTKFTIVAFLPFLPTLWFASAFGFEVGLLWAAGTHLAKFLLNDIWTWKHKKRKNKK